MAKVSLQKICPLKKGDYKLITIEDTEVEILQYLPINDKSVFITELINDIIDDNYIINPIRQEVLFNIKLIQKYTNLNLTETMLKDLPKLYDLLNLNNIIAIVKNNIPEKELNDLQVLLQLSLKELQQFGTSALGLFQTIAADKTMTEDNVKILMDELSDPNRLSLVKDILEKMG